METYAAFLRAVNVSGTKRLAMAELRLALEHAGFEQVRSLLQSGNLLFRTARASDAAGLARRVEREIHERLGVQTDVLMRTADELESILERNPFVAEAERDPAHVVVMFLRERATQSSVERLRAAIAGPERVAAGACELYLTYPGGIGESRLTNAAIERALGTRGTARNWNTLRKLAAGARRI